MEDLNATNPTSTANPDSGQGQGVAPAPQFDNPGADVLAGSQSDLDHAQQTLDDDSEEVEHEGQKYRIPKALKPALMFNADYTRKTQEVAEQRRALETQQTQLAQQAQMHQQHLQEVARVVAIDEQLSQFAQVDWTALSNRDPVSAQQLWMQFSQLKDSRAALLGQLQQKEQQRALEMQRNTAKRLEEAKAVLTRDIKGWTPELEGKLSNFGTTLGFTAQEMEMAKADPRVFKLLHAAFIGNQLVAQQNAAGNPAVPAARPVAQVGGNAPAGKDPSRMSDDEWLANRTKNRK